MRYRLFLFAIVPLAVAVAPVCADTVVANYTSLGQGNSPWTSNKTSSESFWAGQIDFQQLTGLAGGTHGVIMNQTTDGHFAAYCIELTTTLTGNPHTFDVVGSAGLTASNVLGTSTAAIERLFSYALSTSATQYGDILTYSGGSLDDAHGAAFQLALWALIYDPLALHVDSIDHTGGVLLVGDATSISDANTLLANASAWSDSETDLVALVNDNGPPNGPDQDQIVIGFARSQSVPLPGAVAAAVPILMLGGTTLKSKRRRRQAEESAL